MNQSHPANKQPVARILRVLAQKNVPFIISLKFATQGGKDFIVADLRKKYDEVVEVEVASDETAVLKAKSPQKFVAMANNILDTASAAISAKLLYTSYELSFAITAGTHEVYCVSNQLKVGTPYQYWTCMLVNLLETGKCSIMHQPVLEKRVFNNLSEWEKAVEKVKLFRAVESDWSSITRSVWQELNGEEEKEAEGVKELVHEEIE